VDIVEVVNRVVVDIVGHNNGQRAVYLYASDSSSSLEWQLDVGEKMQPSAVIEQINETAFTSLAKTPELCCKTPELCCKTPELCCKVKDVLSLLLEFGIDSTLYPIGFQGFQNSINANDTLTSSFLHKNTSHAIVKRIISKAPRSNVGYLALVLEKKTDDVIALHYSFISSSQTALIMVMLGSLRGLIENNMAKANLNINATKVKIVKGLKIDDVDSTFCMINASCAQIASTISNECTRLGICEIDIGMMPNGLSVGFTSWKLVRAFPHNVTN